MALTQSQKSLIERVQSAGGGELGTDLSDDAYSFLVATIIHDLSFIAQFSELANRKFPEVFEEIEPRKLELQGLNFTSLLERLIVLVPDTDTYFACLAMLHKSRLKYVRILEHQPIPTMDQVRSRALLQYGQMSPKGLAEFLLWRKWIYDIDNRSAQETGYLFEPIILSSLSSGS